MSGSFIFSLNLMIFKVNLLHFDQWEGFTVPVQAKISYRNSHPPRLAFWPVIISLVRNGLLLLFFLFLVPKILKNSLKNSVRKKYSKKLQ